MSLAALLDATPMPPADNVEAACREMVAARQIIIDNLTDFRVAADERPLVDELARRDAAWQDALAQVRKSLGDQRIASRKVRAYSDDRQIRRHR